MGFSLRSEWQAWARIDSDPDIRVAILTGTDDTQFRLPEARAGFIDH